ncbi:hypothetical protein [Ramlibacter sp. PS4R-6]|uniref:hypothetical protein n=1 Tax=Ramlibacter sp. PS4R-6 TaxID=3133438 RepID=UPI0030AD8F7E
MHYLQATLAFVASYFVTVKAVTWILQWLVAIWAQAKPGKDGTRSIAAVVAVMFVSPGPWVVAVLVGLAAHFRDAWWAVWAACGSVAGLVFLAGVTAYVMQRQKRRQGEHAA